MTLHSSNKQTSQTHGQLLCRFGAVRTFDVRPFDHGCTTYCKRLRGVSDFQRGNYNQPVHVEICHCDDSETLNPAAGFLCMLQTISTGGHQGAEDRKTCLASMVQGAVLKSLRRAGS